LQTTVNFGNTNVRWFQSLAAVWRVQRAKQRTIKAFANELAFAKGEGSQRRQNILEDEHEELRLIDDEMGIVVSQRLCRQAAHYLVPVPQGKDDWEESSIFGTTYRYPAIVRAFKI
jgi:hypothetical protein